MIFTYLLLCIGYSHICFYVYDIRIFVFMCMIFTYLVYVYDIHHLNLNSMDTPDEPLQDTVLIKANLMSQIPTIIINNTKDARICV